MARLWGDGQMEAEPANRWHVSRGISTLVLMKLIWLSSVRIFGSDGFRPCSARCRTRFGMASAF